MCKDSLAYRQAGRSIDNLDIRQADRRDRQAWQANRQENGLSCKRAHIKTG